MNYSSSVTLLISRFKMKKQNTTTRKTQKINQWVLKLTSTKKMKADVPTKVLFILLAFNVKLNPTQASKLDYLDRIDTSKMNNMSTFSFICQDQIVKVESKNYHLDRFRSSLKSAYFEKLFISEQKNNAVIEIQSLLNREVFPAIIDLIHGKELSDVLNKDNYIPLLQAMDHLEMEIDLKNFSNFMDHNLASYSLQEAKIFDLYDFITKNPKFEYLFESVFKHFSNDMMTLQNHTTFSSLPLEHLIRMINKVENSNDVERHIIQICTEWLCHDMENRIFHMGKLVISIESTFRSAIETNTGISKYLPKCDADEQTKRKIISRCLFALLAGKNLNFEKLDEWKPKTLKSLSPQGENIFKCYSSVRKNNTLKYVLNGVFEYFANNLETLQNHKMFSSLPFDHLVQIIKNIQEPTDEKRYKIIQMCTEWLCNDIENRLPYLPNLVITAKSLFHSSMETEKNASNCLPKCHVDEKLKRKIISSCLWALLTNGEKLDFKILTDDESNYFSDDGYYLDVDEGKSYNAREYVRLVNPNDEYVKLRIFLNNSDFYDITVRAGNKTYKLHRTILESTCGYFKNIFRVEYAESVACHEMPKCPTKDKEYLLKDPIDSPTFKALIDYIYFGTFVKYDGWTDKDVIVRIFLSGNTLKIKDGRLLEYCKKQLMDKYFHKKVSSQDIEILYSTYGKMKHEDLYLFYLCKHMTVKWPDIYNIRHFCSISWTMLENMLRSPHLQLGHRNPQKILDICSKWISHDVKNRYTFLPQIAQIINPHCVVDHGKYTIDVAAELNDFSQQLIKDELWEILSSLSYNQSAELSKNMQRKLKEIPAFIAHEYDKGTIEVLNVDLDLLVSINCSGLSNTYWRGTNSMATLIGDNLFVLYTDYFLKVTFFVYNFVLKRRFPLRFGLKSGFDLLNCNNEVYGYSTLGQLVKYSRQLNRWMIIWEPVNSNKDSFRFTSNGETIYRTREYCEQKYVIDAYNFGNNSWHAVLDLPVMDCLLSPNRLTVVNDRDFVLSNFAYIILLLRDSKTWRSHELPNTLWELHSFITQHEDRILFVSKNRVHRFFPSNGSLEFMKDLPQMCIESEWYRRINVIHRIVRT